MSPRLPIAVRAEPIPFSLRTRTREVILDAARRLYGREGYSAVTMRALADEIGCSATAIYTYFKDKNEIISALQRQGLHVYAAFVANVANDDPVMALREFFLRYYAFSKRHPEYFNLLWVDRATPPFGPSEPDLKTAIIEGHALAQRCIDEGAFRRGVSVVTITQVLWSAVHGPAVLNHLSGRGLAEVDTDALAAATLDLALAGFRSGVLISTETEDRPHPGTRFNPKPKPDTPRRRGGGRST